MEIREEVWGKPTSMSYGTLSREQELENALQRLLDLYDEEVLVVSGTVSDDVGASVEDALSNAAIALALEDDEEEVEIDF